MVCVSGWAKVLNSMGVIVLHLKDLRGIIDFGAQMLCSAICCISRMVSIICFSNVYVTLV